MSKKNILPNQPQPVIRTHVAKPALEGLTEENLTTTSPQGQEGLAPAGTKAICFCDCFFSDNGDDAE